MKGGSYTVSLRSDLPSTTQERAWPSPIWVSPYQPKLYSIGKPKKTEALALKSAKFLFHLSYLGDLK